MENKSGNFIILTRSVDLILLPNVVFVHRTLLQVFGDFASLAVTLPLLLAQFLTPKNLIDFLHLASGQFSLLSWIESK